MYAYIQVTTNLNGKHQRRSNGMGAQQECCCSWWGVALDRITPGQVARTDSDTLTINLGGESKPFNHTTLIQTLPAPRQTKERHTDA
jgi:hypothetical protein